MKIRHCPHCGCEIIDGPGIVKRLGAAWAEITMRVPEEDAEDMARYVKSAKEQYVRDRVAGHTPNNDGSDERMDA